MDNYSCLVNNEEHYLDLDLIHPDGCDVLLTYDKQNGGWSGIYMNGPDGYNILNDDEIHKYIDLDITQQRLNNINFYSMDFN